ncbi:MAG: HAMP domain-containing protein, partial [Planctomycetota bacterium]
MAVSLKTRLTLILALVNAVVLGSLALWVAGDDVQRQASAQRRQSERKALAEELFSKRFEPERAGDLAKMIDWPLWHEFSDALILDTRVVPVGSMQEIHPAGVILNPLGLKNRRPDFPLQEVVRGITAATRQVEKIPVAGGLALPLITPDRRIWGGVFVLLPSLPSPPSLSQRVLLAAGAATVLGAALLYLLVHRSLLAPVEGLAAAAQAFGRHRSVPLPERTGSSEVEELVTAFREMRTLLDGFQQELRREVAAATRRAGEAERRAARQDRLAALGTLGAGLAPENN